MITRAVALVIRARLFQASTLSKAQQVARLNPNGMKKKVPFQISGL